MKNIQKVVLPVILLLGTHIALSMEKEDSPLLTTLKEERIETIPEFIEVLRLMGEQGKPLGNSILHDAVLLRQYKIVTQLLDQGADANIINFVNGNTPLFEASRTDIADLLLAHGAQVSVVNAYGDTVLHSTPACFLHKMTEWFIAKGADVNAVNNQKETPLHNVCRKKCAEKLIAHGAKLNVCDDKGDTPLHNAVSNGYQDIVELFVENGADIHAKGYLEDTPLHRAALNGGHKDIAAFLIKKGAGINCKNVFNENTIALCKGQ